MSVLKDKSNADGELQHSQIISTSTSTNEDANKDIYAYSWDLPSELLIECEIAIRNILPHCNHLNFNQFSDLVEEFCGISYDTNVIEATSRFLDDKLFEEFKKMTVMYSECASMSDLFHEYFRLENEVDFEAEQWDDEQKKILVRPKN